MKKKDHENLAKLQNVCGQLSCVRNTLAILSILLTDHSNSIQSDDQNNCPHTIDIIAIIPILCCICGSEH